MLLYMNHQIDTDLWNSVRRQYTCIYVYRAPTELFFSFIECIYTFRLYQALKKIIFKLHCMALLAVKITSVICCLKFTNVKLLCYRLRFDRSLYIAYILCAIFKRAIGIAQCI